MSKLFAVSYMDFFNNNLITELHYADDWQDALSLHTKVVTDSEYMEFINAVDMEEAKEDAFNGDWLFDVVEVRDNV